MDKKFNIASILVLVLVVAGLFYFYYNSKNSSLDKENSLGDSGEVMEDVMTDFAGEVFAVSIPESQINWTGRKTLIANYEDKGTLSFKSGEFFVEEGQLTGGKAVFDMDTIKAESTGLLSGESNLTNHLKSEAFFSVAMYPTAEILITKVEPMEGEGQFNLSGKLTIKGITNDVSFPASVEISNDSVNITGQTELDRTLWDIRFGSSKFFDDLANNVIDDLFTVKFNITANR